MKKNISILFLLIVLISCSDGHNSPFPNCDINIGPCIKSHEGKKMILDIEPRPVRAMEVLNFRIALRNYREPDSIVIDLSMPEMPMGSNQVVLKKTGKGAFSEEGIIPVCPSGKKLWKAGIIINGRLEGGFLFNVGY